MLKYIRLHKTGELPRIRTGFGPEQHDTLVHNDQANGWTPVSAGFVHFGPTCGITTHGTSVSLNLSPRPDDAAIITAFYNSTAALSGCALK